MNRFENLDRFRVTKGMWATDPGAPYGLFFVSMHPGKPPLKIIAAPFDGNTEWEHVSVSLPNRCPVWEEMCMVKDLFWHPEDCVIQFHPPRSEHVNNARYCLHLWRNKKQPTQTPSSLLVGLKELGNIG